MIKRVIKLFCLVFLLIPAFGLTKPKAQESKTPIYQIEASEPTQIENNTPIFKLTFDTQLNYLYQVSNSQTKAQTTEHLVI